jgi:hypothetical protein
MNAFIEVITYSWLYPHPKQPTRSNMQLIYWLWQCNNTKTRHYTGSRAGSILNPSWHHTSSWFILILSSHLHINITEIRQAYKSDIVLMSAHLQSWEKQGTEKIKLLTFRSADHSCSAQALGSWVRIPLKAWMYVCVFPVLVVVLRRDDLPSRESYRLFTRSTVS